MIFSILQKHKNTMSGSEFQRNKEDVAAIMREKQRKGMEDRCWIETVLCCVVLTWW